jgi:hypothetical protein
MEYQYLVKKTGEGIVITKGEVDTSNEVQDKVLCLEF